MSDIFVSYKREERDRARRIADALQHHGWSVWWDPKLRAGEHFDDVIEEALDAATCVIVLWSPLSVRSRFVKDEATHALERGKLVPVMIEEVEPPFRFRSLHTRRLQDWDGGANHAEFVALVADLRDRIEGGGPSPSPPAASATPDSWWRELIKQPPRTTPRQPGSTAGVTSPILPRDLLSSSPALWAETSQRLIVPRRAPLPPVAKGKPDSPTAPKRPASAAVPGSEGELVAKVNHYYDQLGVAGFDAAAAIRVGDVLRFKGSRTDFVQMAASIERNRRQVEAVAAGTQGALKTSSPVQRGDGVYRLDFAKYLADRERALGITRPPATQVVGLVEHYFSRARAATVILAADARVAQGARLHVRGTKTDLEQPVVSLQIDRRDVSEVTGPIVFGLAVPRRVHAGDLVYV